MHNHFLNGLKPADLRALQSSLRHAELCRDERIAEDGGAVETIYLPINCVISVVAVMKDGRSVETRTIGCEGGYGLLNALGSPFCHERAFVQIGGQCWTLPLKVMTHAANDSATLVRSLVQHAQASLLQAGQSAACNTLHTAEQRLARWLLLTRERTASEILPLTQEHLSIMLGVQRTTVTAIAQDMQERGLVSYARGRIRITDYSGLLACSCECYEAIESAAKQVLDQPA